jgi:CheY-like chemotaxis protein
MAHVLIIDDEPRVCTVLRRYLESDAHSVVEAYDGRHGLELCKSDTPDLVITDIFMPEMDGIEVIRALASLRPWLPILAISGGHPDEYLKFAQLFGAFDVLQKPIDKLVLLCAVRALLDPIGAA